jgi:hypothetical protein
MIFSNKRAATRSSGPQAANDYPPRVVPRDFSHSTSAHLVTIWGRPVSGKLLASGTPGVARARIQIQSYKEAHVAYQALCR